jgi:HEAT repeat protein/cyclophilin family peptidyl-prolyl cis-trans isomerase
MISSRRLVKPLPLLRTWVAVMVAVLAAACASAPPAPPPAAPTPEETYQTKIAAIVRLEDRRVLRDPAGAAPDQPAFDLTALVRDGEARIRRRAALAIGHVGLSEGVPALVPLLDDGDPEVRQMAAFALGLIGDASPRDRLETALDDPSPLVDGSAAEALGMMGDVAAAPAVGRMLARIVQAGEVTKPPPAQDESRRDTLPAAFRLGVFALVRLHAFDPLAQAVLDASGQPRVNWWPVAYALARLGDKRGEPALITLAKDPDPYTRAYAAEGLGAMGDSPDVAALLVRMLGSPERSVVVEAIRALARLGDRAAVAPIEHFIEAPDTDPLVRLEAVAAAGQFKGATNLASLLLDLFAYPNPDIRAAALSSAAALDPDGFVTALSGLDPDPQWQVRAALARVLGTLPPARGIPRLTEMLGDQDQRVIPAVLGSLVKLHANGIGDLLVARLKADDPLVRSAAAAGVGELKPPNGVGLLIDAFHLGQHDPESAARLAALQALIGYGADAARPTIMEALGDQDWSVRRRAVELLRAIDPAAASQAEATIRPAPTRLAEADYAAPFVTDPPVSPLAYVDTDRGNIQIELAVLDAPLTVANFMALARRNFFNGLTVYQATADLMVATGDPRGDGHGGPGYTIRDEINERPFLRGAVGLAEDSPDGGGSRFFITVSPQPQLDGRETVFGRVVSGMDVVDKLQPWDVIRTVQIWDGTVPP